MQSVKIIKIEKEKHIEPRSPFLPCSTLSKITLNLSFELGIIFGVETLPPTPNSKPNGKRLCILINTIRIKTNHTKTINLYTILHTFLSKQNKNHIFRGCENRAQRPIQQES